MIVLNYYYYSPFLEKDTHCGVQYNDLQQVTKCLCVIPEKSMSVEEVLYRYREKTQKEQLLLLVPDAVEYNYAVRYFRKRFEQSLEETMTLLMNLLQVPTELVREIRLARKEEKNV